MNWFQIVFLLWVCDSRRQKITETKHCIKRCTNFMAHIGQKFWLRPVGCFCLISGCFQCTFKLFVFCNILMCSHHHRWFVILCPGNNLSSIQNPDPWSVFMFHSCFTFIIVKFPWKMLFKQWSALFKIIRMSKFRPGFNWYRRNFFQGITNDFCPAMIEKSFPCLNIPFPCANVCAS